MNFGEALEKLKKGKKLAREGWNGKDMWIGLMPKVTIEEQLVNGRSRMLLPDGKDLECQPYIVMWTANEKWQPGWLASQTDMLAEDWVVVG